jgi:hypothetical protein
MKSVRLSRGPEPDSNFKLDFADLDWVLIKRAQMPAKPPLRAPLTAPLMDWISAWRGGTDAPSAYAAWQHDHALPSLIIATAVAL